MDVNTLTRSLVERFGDGADGTCPTPAQWAHVLGRSPEKPVTLINFFKLREKALYTAGEPAASGQEAFSRYAAVSMPTMERVGGTFLFVGPYGGAFLGPDESWDAIAIGAYPNLNALADLYSDEAYQQAFKHRTAACERQKVLIAG